MKVSNDNFFRFEALLSVLGVKWVAEKVLVDERTFQNRRCFPNSLTKSKIVICIQRQENIGSKQRESHTMYGPGPGSLCTWPASSVKNIE